MPSRERVRCTDLCRYAKGHDCSCSCGGENHGKGRDFMINFEKRPAKPAVQSELFEEEVAREQGA